MKVAVFNVNVCEQSLWGEYGYEQRQRATLYVSYFYFFDEHPCF